MRGKSFDPAAARTVRYACLICASVLFMSSVGTTLSLCLATDALAQQDTAPNILAVPTTKLLAIGTFTARASPAQWKPFLPAEVRDTVRLYLDGKIDQWFLKQDQSGVVFLMNVTDPAEARELLGRLPLGQAGLMEFELVPLGPIAALRVLLPPASK